MRPSKNLNSREVCIHLREICSVNVEKYNESLYIFGCTSDRISVGIEILNFKPYVFVEYDSDVDVDVFRTFSFLAGRMQAFIIISVVCFKKN